MSGPSPEIQQQASHDVQRLNGTQGSGDKARVLADEVNSARQNFTNPSDYNSYITGLRNNLAGDNPDHNLLPAVTLFDPNHEGTLVKDLVKDNDALYRRLDTYAGKGGADGQVGSEDIKNFINDAKNDPNSDAAKYAKDHPELISLLAAQQSTGFDKTRLLSDLGYSKFDDFQRDNPGDMLKPLVIGDPKHPDTIVGSDGVSTGLHYDKNGNIDGINNTANGMGNLIDSQVHRGPDGRWLNAQNEEVPVAAPFIDKDNNFGFYTPVEGDPNKFNKVTIDSQTGAVNTLPVDLNGKNPDGSDVAIAGLNRPLQVDPNNHDPFKVGNLDVTPTNLNPGQQVGDPNLQVNGQASYQIAQGDNLTNIARQALGKPADYDGADLQAAINQIAKANGYDNPDQIPADTKLVIPPDFNPQPSDAATQPVDSALATPPADQNLIGPAIAPQEPQAGDSAPEAAPQDGSTLVGPAAAAPADSEPALIGPAAAPDVADPGMADAA